MRLKNYQLSLLLGLLFTLCLTNSAFAGAISGKIVYDGEVPKLRPIKMDADPICLSKHTDKVLPQTIVLGENKELSNVFVHVTSGIPKKAFPAPKEPIVITQEGCQYNPHVLGVLIGQPVKILNPDGTLHNIHAMSKINKEFNLAMPKFRKETTKIFDKEEFMFPLKCDVHPWMGAWISVMTHPYFSTTGTDGIFTIAKLPPGTYKIEAWHEKLGTQTASITITGDETQEANFTFSRPTKK